MKVFLLLTFIYISFANANNSIIGTWKFTNYNYHGETHPIPNPDLDLRFTFDNKGFSFLKWTRLNEEGYCFRIADYRIEMDRYLIQKTVWVDPQNNSECAKDPEMRLGQETFTPYEKVGDQLWLNLELAGEPFIYILSPVF